MPNKKISKILCLFLLFEIAIDVESHKENRWGIKISEMGDKIIIDDVREGLQFANKGAEGGMEIICINSIAVDKPNSALIKKILKRTPSCKMVLRVMNFSENFKKKKKTIVFLKRVFKNVFFF